MPEKTEVEISGFNASDTASDTFQYQCPICLEYLVEEYLFTLCTCGCHFCKKCLATYITTAMEFFYDHDLRCPGFSCSRNGKLTDSEIFYLVPLPVYRRYEAQKLQRAIDKDCRLTYCPRNECSTVCQIHSPLTTPLQTRVPLPPDILSIQQKKGHILQRLYSICTRRTNGYDLTKCFDWRSDFPESRQTAPESSTMKRLALPVTCPKCGYHFCARCHRRWHTGQPPYPCNLQTRLKRKTLENSFKVFCQQQLSELKHTLVHYFKNVHLEPGDDHAGTESAKKKLLAMDETLVIHNDEKRPELFEDSSVRIFISEADGGAQQCQPGFSSDSPPEYEAGNSDTIAAKVTAVADEYVERSSEETSQTAMDFLVGFPPYPVDAQYKRCPICFVPVERVDGCAQMCCHLCKRTFCWYCLTSLDTDILLRHFDSGSCQGKLGHSSGSLLRHRLFVIFTIVLFLIMVVISAPVAIIVLTYFTCVDIYKMRQLRRRRQTVEYYLQRHLPTLKESPAAVPTDQAISTVTEARPRTKDDTVERALIHWSSDCDANTNGLSTPDDLRAVFSV